MTDPLARAAEVLRRALVTSSSDPVRVRLTVPRETAELFLAVIDAQRRGGAVVLRARREVSPAAAAELLGVSRSKVYRWLDQGRLEYRRVGANRRISIGSLAAVRAEENARQHRAMSRLALLSDQYGVTD